MKTPREIGADVLHGVLMDGGYANILLNRALFGVHNGRDRAFITNLVYGAVQKKTPLDYQLNRFLKKPVRKKDKYLETLLRAGLYELFFSAAKPYAVVNEYVKIGKKRGGPIWGKVINGVLRNAERQLTSPEWPDCADDAERNAFFQSLPFWLVDLWKRERGEETASRLIDAIGEEHPPVLRVNTLKTDRNKLKKLLAEKGIEATEGALSADALRLPKGSDLRNLPQELFAVQEESSQLVAAVLAPKPGESVLDMCAAPGGKTTHIAQKMENAGVIRASDLYDHKIELIRQNAERLGITIIRAETKDALLWGEEAPAGFDAVLLDAPCSGLGVLGRRPDSRLRKKESDVAELGAIQRKLLESAYRALRPGGRLVYSTCTLTRTENETNALWFVQTHPDIRFLPFADRVGGLNDEESAAAAKGMLELMPYHHHTDGFFIACFEKECK